MVTEGRSAANHDRSLKVLMGLRQLHSVVKSALRKDVKRRELLCRAFKRLKSLPDGAAIASVASRKTKLVHRGLSCAAPCTTYTDCGIVPLQSEVSPRPLASAGRVHEPRVSAVAVDSAHDGNNIDFAPAGYLGTAPSSGTAPGDDYRLLRKSAIPPAECVFTTFVDLTSPAKERDSALFQEMSSVQYAPQTYQEVSVTDAFPDLPGFAQRLSASALDLAERLQPSVLQQEDPPARRRRRSSVESSRKSKTMQRAASISMLTLETVPPAVETVPLPEASYANDQLLDAPYQQHLRAASIAGVSAEEALAVAQLMTWEKTRTSQAPLQDAQQYQVSSAVDDMQHLALEEKHQAFQAPPQDAHQYQVSLAVNNIHKVALGEKNRTSQAPPQDAQQYQSPLAVDEIHNMALRQKSRTSQASPQDAKQYEVACDAVWTRQRLPPALGMSPGMEPMPTAGATDEAPDLEVDMRMCSFTHCRAPLGAASASASSSSHTVLQGDSPPQEEQAAERRGQQGDSPPQEEQAAECRSKQAASPKAASPKKRLHISLSEAANRRSMAASVLEVNKDAPVKMVDSAFRKRALDLHPDKGGSVADFQVLNQAYRTMLSNSTGKLVQTGPVY